ncbi:hypothetical protein [Hyalangium rubrum]|uniref:Uncharacterized protein n=1 Tax=Hyalangium rubrum TaxID=3103134 RepID=A0ABU5HB15_9BACT|nr:hypothetical protein [Hyalangium sp. s54d21]MDY7229315.1 hypothetical protein [Hyalangium sp. s54d21]
MAPINNYLRRNPLARYAPLLQKGVTDAVNRAKDKVAQDPAGQAKKVVDTFTSVRDGIQGARDQRQAVRDNGFKDTFKKNWSNAANPQINFDKATALKQGMKGLGLVDNLRNLPGQVNTAIQDARQGFRSGATQQERDKAIGSVATASKTTLGTLKTGIELGRDASKVVGTYRAASKAFSEVAPDATRGARFAAASTATKEVLGGAEKTKDVANAARAAVSELAGGTRAGVPDVMGGGTVKAANRALTQAAGEAAGAAVAKNVGKTAAKAAGRFVPGLNVAMAAADAATAYSTVRDPNASATKKVTSVVTALGSAAAATNIPVVSQVGAAVSAVSGLVGGLFG